tara:strand:+ start:369 stop:560 length:192 start_codon:yes stop_codon:yes gene_type:complete
MARYSNSGLSDAKTLKRTDELSSEEPQIASLLQKGTCLVGLLKLKGKNFKARLKPVSLILAKE